jgi:hypothetical protein
MKTKSSTLEGIGWAVWIMLVGYNCVHYFLQGYGHYEENLLARVAGGVGGAIGSNLGDLYLWLLTIGLVWAHYRNQKR